MNKLKLLGALALAGSMGIMGTAANARQNTDAFSKGRGNGPTIYVQTQGFFYDSIVLAHLPMKGDFQQLLPGVGASGLATEFGPGDVGYLGGRWWVDANPNGYMDADDVFFMCPLLGPARTTIDP